MDVQFFHLILCFLSILFLLLQYFFRSPPRLCRARVGCGLPVRRIGIIAAAVSGGNN